MGKWWHTLASIGMIALTAFTPYIQTAVASHPILATSLTLAWSILGHILPSPLPVKQ
jgi:hypothetical protein